MPANYRAFLYVVVAIAAAHLLCSITFRRQKEIINRTTMGWVLLTFMLFFTPSVPLYFLGAGIGLLILRPRKVDNRLQFYFAMLPVIPATAIWQVTLPGIETLISLDHIKFLSLVLLIPLYLSRNVVSYESDQSDYTDSQSKNVFIMFFAFLLFAMLLELRESNITGIVRGIFEKSLHELILVLVVFKLCRSIEMVDKVLFAVLISGVSIAFISCIEAATSWILYNEINPGFFRGGITPLAIIADFRGGIMRTPVMMTPIPFGFYMGFCLALHHYFSGLKKRGNAAYGGSLLISCVLFAGLVFSGSRGAWAVTVLMFVLMFIMQNRFKSLRRILGLLCVVALFSFPVIIRHLAANDPYGTFQYRINLFNNSMMTIKDSFLLGSLNYFDHPAMQASMQGQGLIDIVNTYVGIALAYGVPMLFLIIFVILTVIVRVARLRKRAEKSEEMKLLEWQARMLLSLIIGGFVMIVTVSLVDRLAHYLWVSLVLGICIYRYGYRKEKVRKVVPED